MAASGLPEFRDLPGLIAEHARAWPEAIALRCELFGILQSGKVGMAFALFAALAI